MCHNHDKNFDSIVVILCIWLDQGRSQGGHGGMSPHLSSEERGKESGKRRKGGGKWEREEERVKKRRKGGREEGKREERRKNGGVDMSVAQWTQWGISHPPS